MSEALAQASPSPRPLLHVEPVQPSFGAEISGVDLSTPLSTALRDEIRALLVKHKVIFFRDQDITREQQLAFAANFGPPVIHPLQEKKEAARAEKLPHGVHEITVPQAEYKKKRRTLHADGSWQSPIAFATFLRAVNIPKVGGDTLFVNTAAVYAALSDSIKERIEDLFAVHEYKELKAANIPHPIIAHPLVINHPETGEDHLYIDFIMSPSIVGWDRKDSDALLDELYEEAVRPDYQLRFKWTKGAIAVWDNRSTLHTAIHDYGDFPRLMERVVVGSNNDIPYRNPERRFVRAVTQ
jgi:alpha-ketoglutarate-dependent taurine dioxygenase